MDLEECTIEFHQKLFFCLTFYQRFWTKSLHDSTYWICKIFWWNVEQKGLSQDYKPAITKTILGSGSCHSNIWKFNRILEIIICTIHFCIINSLFFHKNRNVHKSFLQKLKCFTVQCMHFKGGILLQRNMPEVFFCLESRVVIWCAKYSRPTASLKPKFLDFVQHYDS